MGWRRRERGASRGLGSCPLRMELSQPAEGSRAGSLPTGSNIHCGGLAGVLVEVPEEEMYNWG